MDSTVLAHYIAASPRLSLVGCVSINYGQRHKFELKCAEQTCRDLDVPHHLIDLSALRNHISASSLTSDQPVPLGHYAEASMKATVVPNRNMILIALAVAVGITQGAKCVAYGAHAGDHAVYPDCRPSFADALAQAVDMCDYNPPTLLRPFIELTKAQIVRKGLDLGVNFRHTWTCYQGVPENTVPEACGKCGTCVERLEAFALCNAEDPIVYQDRTYWREVIAKGEPQHQQKDL